MVLRERLPTSGISSSPTSNFLTTRSLGTSLLSARRLDVLVHVEEVVRVVRRLDLGEPLVVLAVARLHAILALLHHHVHVGAARRERVERVVVAARPGA